MELQNVVLVDGARSAFGRGGRGMLVGTRLDDAAATVLRTLMERNPKVDPWLVEDIGLGNVMGAGELLMNRPLNAIKPLSNLNVVVTADVEQHESPPTRALDQ